MSIYIEKFYAPLAPLGERGGGEGVKTKGSKPFPTLVVSAEPWDETLPESLRKEPRQGRHPASREDNHVTSSPMKNLRLILSLAVLTAGLEGAALAAGQAAPASVREITMTAKNYEFDPAVITVKKGEKVRLIITATDRDHGIKIAGYDINQVLKKGDPTTVEFTAEKAGTFEFKCSVFCGMGHGKMKGKLVVEE
jgi:cytochrome c oxidase subunit 2